MRNLLLLCAVAACAFGFAAAKGSATEPATLVVDRGGVECADADFDSIQAAVARAQPGDLIRVCPGLYTESVVVDKPLTLEGEPEAVEAVDCFDPTPSQLGDLDPTQQAIIDPPGDGFSVAFKLEANDIVLAGFVVEGATVGIDAADRFSGYRIHHNLIRLNTLFGVDFGSSGTNLSRADHNCFRENSYGLVSELDDDSLAERDESNARYLVNARIDHNSTFRHQPGLQAGLEAAGPGRHDRLTFDHNVSREDRIGIALQNSQDSAILENDITLARHGIYVGGATEDLRIARNYVHTARLPARNLAGQGIVFVPPTGFLDSFDAPATDVLVSENTVTGFSDGIIAAPFPGGRLVDSTIVNNITNENVQPPEAMMPNFGAGIRLHSGNVRNTVRGNQADRNSRYGIWNRTGATANTYLGNSMFGNGVADAADDAWGANEWIGNLCAVGFPQEICNTG